MLAQKPSLFSGQPSAATTGFQLGRERGRRGLGRIVEAGFGLEIELVDEELGEGLLAGGLFFVRGLEVGLEAFHVGGGDLQAVEHDGGAAEVDLVVLESAEDLHDGELDGGGIFEEGEGVVLAGGGLVEVAVEASAAGGRVAGLAVEAGVLAARGLVGEVKRSHGLDTPRGCG